MASLEQEINGDPAALSVERAAVEMRHGRAIQLCDGNRRVLITAVEAMAPPLLDRLQSLPGGRMRLLMTAERLRAAGLAGDSIDGLNGPVSIFFPRGADLEELRALAGIVNYDPLKQASLTVQCWSGHTALAEAGFRLAKLGRLLPALVTVEAAEVSNPDFVKTRVEDIERYVRCSHSQLTVASRARVPLADALDCEIVLFRQQHGLGEHLAILIGEPDLKAVVPVRLHSACLTGDLLGSLRCDCGDQLRRAVTRIASLGGGVLLYLDQEGRGIGLANKLRAYALQDAGLDTVDADRHLGFLPDERNYDVAATMLHELGLKRIRLLTNNPLKIDALREHGVEVAGRLPLLVSANAYNQGYLKAKLDRAGHLAE